MYILALLLVSLRLSPGDTYELVASVSSGTDTITVTRGFLDRDACASGLVYLAKQKNVVDAYCVQLPLAT